MKRWTHRRVMAYVRKIDRQTMDRHTLWSDLGAYAVERGEFPGPWVTPPRFRRWMRKTQIDPVREGQAHRRAIEELWERLSPW